MNDREKIICAIERAKRQSEEYAQDRIFVPFKEADMIISLLKEQEPVEPRWTHPEVDTSLLMCGGCGVAIPLGKPNYCPWCGKKVLLND